LRRYGEEGRGSVSALATANTATFIKTAVASVALR